MADLDKTKTGQFLSYAAHRRTDSLGVCAEEFMGTAEDLGFCFEICFVVSSQFLTCLWECFVVEEIQENSCIQIVQNHHTHNQPIMSPLPVLRPPPSVSGPSAG